MLTVVANAVKRFEELKELLAEEDRLPTAAEMAEIDTLLPRVLCAMREAQGEVRMTGGSARDAWTSGRVYNVSTL